MVRTITRRLLFRFEENGVDTDPAEMTEKTPLLLPRHRHAFQLFPGILEKTLEEVFNVQSIEDVRLPLFVNDEIDPQIVLESANSDLSSSRTECVHSSFLFENPLPWQADRLSDGGI